MKKKVALFLDNSGCSNKDVSKPWLGNPGIGGTQFNIITLSYYYNKYFDDVEFIYYLLRDQSLHEGVSYYVVHSLKDAIEHSKKIAVDIFIYRPLVNDEYRKVLEQSSDTNIVLWAHNTPFGHLDLISKKSNVKRYVPVATEQYDMLRDHDIIYKSKPIYNLFDITPYSQESKPIERDRSVVYLGSLIKSKGFHALARNWKSILKIVPDAKLIVIGSGNLYNQNASLGKFNIASENYENEFMQYLQDDKNNLLDSVEFKGLMGTEKISIMANASVGCPNPTGVTENCPGSAIEFQAVGTPVVTGAFWGMHDTVLDGKTGYLCKYNKEFVEKICYLLQNKGVVDELGSNGIKFIEERFSPKKITTQWNELFDDIYHNNSACVLPIKDNIEYENKWLLEVLRIIKQRFPNVKSYIPPYIKWRRFIHKSRNIFSKDRLDR